MPDPIQQDLVPREIVDPWEGEEPVPPKLDPLIVNPWDERDAGSNPHPAEFSNPWADSPAPPLDLDWLIADPWDDASQD